MNTLKRKMFADGGAAEDNGMGIMAIMAPPPEEMAQSPRSMERSPQNPEILMNNLRGDMRSVDARYAELADMVGEEAAMDTPPEVLAILQDHFAMMDQPQGIGGLPQGAGMALPGMMPQGPRPMGQGPAMPPGGMGGPQLPFPQGGSEGAPPTPDGLPPAEMFGGGIANVGSRFLPYLREVGASWKQQIGTAADELNKYLGRTFMQPQPTARRVIGPDGKPLVAQGRNTMLPGAQPGSLVPGKGTQLRPFTSMSLEHPSLSEGLKQGLGQGYRNMKAEQELLLRLRAPVGGKLLPKSRTAPTAALHTQQGGPRMMAGPKGEPIPTAASTGVPPTQAAAEQAFLNRVAAGVKPNSAKEALQFFTQGAIRDPRVVGTGVVGGVGLGALGAAVEDAAKASPDAAPPAMPYIPDNRPETMALGRGEYGFGRDPEGAVLPMPAPASTTSPAAAEQEAAGEKPVPIDIWEGVDKQPNWIAEAISAPAAKVDKKGRIQRIKDAYGEYLPLYKELVGDDTDSVKANALFLLSDAFFKFGADTESPTMAVALSKAASGIPRGLAVLANDAKERGIKIKTAALDQAVGDITQEDKEAAALRLAMLKGDYQLLKEQAKAMGKTQGQVLTKDGGAGLVYLESKDGSYLGQQAINPNDSTFRSAVSSKYTLQPTSNPFVEYRGPAASTIETDKDARLGLVQKLRTIDDTLREVEQMEGVIRNLYGPGAWASDIYNNVFVPVSAGALDPDLVTERSKATLLRSANVIAKNFASIGDSGRVAVQEQEWARQILKNVLEPTKFFSDTRLAAASVGSTRAALLNARQQVLTQLGYANQDLMAVAPPTGTEGDPFIVPKDEGEANQLYNFLKQTVAKDPKQKGTVFLNINGKVVPRSLESIRSRGVQ